MLMTTSDPGLATGVTPGRRARLVDRAFDVALGLPRARNPYDVVPGIGIAMADGVVLRADHYRPIGAARGTVLVRTRYASSLPWPAEGVSRAGPPPVPGWASTRT